MNITIFYFLHSLAFVYPWMDGLVKFLATPFIYIIISLITIILIWKAKIFEVMFKPSLLLDRSKQIITILSTTLFAYALANILKLLIKTDRPFILLNDIQTLIPESGYAFPSGHSATIAAFAFAVLFKNRQLGYICLVAMLLIGLARVVSGVHFPIDIIGGYVLGFLVAYLFKTR